MRVISADTKEEKAPYKIPFRHRGLQKITGGILGGHMAEISGMSGGGKSFLAYELIAECQKMGGVAVLFDGENAWEDAYGEMLGINMDDGTFLLSQERDMDRVFALMTKLIAATRSKKRDIPILLLVDSYYTLATKKSLDNASEGKDPQGFYHKQKNGKFSSHLDTFVPHIGKAKATFVLLNQTRTVVDEHTGAISYKTLCEEVTQFICTQRIQGIIPRKKEMEEVDTTASTKTGKIKIRSGIKTIWETIKNRHIRPFQKITTVIKYDHGLRRNSGLVELFVNEGLIKSASRTTNRDGQKLVPNKEALKKLGENANAVIGKPAKGFKTIDSEDEVFYYSMKDMLEARPDFLTPRKTADSIQKEVEEDFE